MIKDKHFDAIKLLWATIILLQNVMCRTRTNSAIKFVMKVICY